MSSSLQRFTQSVAAKNAFEWQFRCSHKPVSSTTISTRLTFRVRSSEFSTSAADPDGRFENEALSSLPQCRADLPSFDSDQVPSAAVFGVNQVEVSDVLSCCFVFGNFYQLSLTELIDGLVLASGDARRQWHVDLF